jgi:hypothetical protein
MISSTLLDDTVGDVLSAGIEDAGDGLLVINPSDQAIRDLVTELTEADRPPKIRLFAADGVLNDLMDDFLVASAVADLVDSDVLAVRSLPEVPTNGLLVSEDSVVAVVEGPEQVAGLATTEDPFVMSTFDYYDQQWHESRAFNLRTPALSTIMETLEKDIGPDTAADFRAVLDSLATAQGDENGLDEVTIGLLVAARNDELLYDISRWGEDIGLASKATFSRTKTHLEGSGLLDTEKVPIDVGRPRLRLMLGDRRLEDADIDEFAAIAQGLLA